ncbi:MAG: NUDIX hydrolase [Planctomycetales bacterium]|nr:NUDIX hydrolase [Planctomycetales bacterium]
MNRPFEQPAGEVLLTTPKFRVERLEFTDAGGQPGSKAVVRHPGAVVIVPLLDDGRIGLIRNRRLTVDETLIELPAGTLDPGEDPAACAARELQEETGWQAARLESKGWFYLSPGILDEKMHLFVASELTEVGQNLMPDEQIETYVVSRDEALAMIKSGEIHDAKTQLGLLRCFFDL